MAIKILVDSASDINQKQAEELGIYLIPIIVRIDDVDYQDGVNLLPKEFYKKLEKSETLPKTTQINYFQFDEAFKSLTNNGDNLIVITLSSKISGTYNNALQAAKKYDGKVQVIDSLNATAGERLLCLYALKLIKQGLSITEIVEELEKIKHKIVVFGVLDTLEYLKKGGRISSSVAFVGKLLLIKPVIEVINGEIHNITRIKGTKKINEYVNSKIIEENIDLDLPHCIIYSGVNNFKAVDFINSNKYIINDEDSNASIEYIGSTIGTHIGPNVLGAAFFRK